MITVNITKLFSHLEPWDCSNSVANLGPLAAQFTWNASLELARSWQDWLKSPLPEALDAVCEDARKTGAWTEEEIADWTEADCLAYLVQTLASDLRLLGSDNDDLLGCLATYNGTDWDKEPEDPKAYYYTHEGDVYADWGGL